MIKKTLPIVPDVISVPFTEGDVNKVFQTPLMIGDDGLFLSEFIYKDMVCDHIFFKPISISLKDVYTCI